jgi:hypothetical protein
MVTIANKIFDAEADVDQCKEDVVKTERLVFNLCVENNTTVPPLRDFIEEWIRKHMKLVEKVD